MIGVRFGVWDKDVGFTVWGAGIRDEGSGIREKDIGFAVQGAGTNAQG